MTWNDALTSKPKGKVLVAYAKPFFGTFTWEFVVGYYDAPEDYYNPSEAEGWLTWWRSQPIPNVRFWVELPAEPTVDAAPPPSENKPVP